MGGCCALRACRPPSCLPQGGRRAACACSLQPPLTDGAPPPLTTTLGRRDQSEASLRLVQEYDSSTLSLADLLDNLESGQPFVSRPCGLPHAALLTHPPALPSCPLTMLCIRLPARLVNGGQSVPAPRWRRSPSRSASSSARPTRWSTGCCGSNASSSCARRWSTWQVCRPRIVRGGGEGLGAAVVWCWLPARPFHIRRR